MIKLRMEQSEISALIEMGFDWAVVINGDQTLRVKGAVDSVHYCKEDADEQIKRLDKIYHTKDGWIVVKLMDHINVS